MPRLPSCINFVGTGARVSVNELALRGRAAQCLPRVLTVNVYQGVAHCTQLRHGGGAGIYPCPAASLGIYLPAQQQGLALLAFRAGVGVKAVLC